MGGAEIARARSMGSMKILLFTHEFPPLVGGAGVYTAGLAKGLYALGHDVIVLAPDYDEEVTEWDDKQPYTVIRMSLPEGKIKFLAGSINLVKALVHLRSRIVFVTDWGSHLAASMALLFFPLRALYFITVHGSEINGHFKIEGKRWTWNFFLPVIRRLFTRARAIVCVSKSTQQALLRVLPSLGERAVVVHNGIDLDKFKPINEEQVAKLRYVLDTNGPVFLTVARLIPEKGIDTVLKALSRIVPDIPDLTYVIVGAGSDRDRLNALVKNLSLKNNVIFAGKVSDEELGNYYALCDLFVMISRPGSRIEGFGLVYAEAGACNKPVIAGRTGGVPEVVQDGYNGILVDPYSVDELEKAMRTLLSSPELSRMMGRNGRKLIEEKFNILKMAESTLRIVCARALNREI